MSSEIIVSIPNKKGVKVLLGLIDSGASETLVKESVIKELVKIKKLEVEKKWKTKAAIFATRYKCTLKGLKLRQFKRKQEFDIKDANVLQDDDEKYDIILGRNTNQEIGMDNISSRLCFQWAKNEVNITTINFWTKESRLNYEVYIVENNIEDELNEMYDLSKTTRNNYHKIKFEEESKKLSHLSRIQQNKLVEIWQEYKDVFKGTVGKYTKFQITLEFKKGAT